MENKKIKIKIGVSSVDYSTLEILGELVPPAFPVLFLVFGLESLQFWES